MHAWNNYVKTQIIQDETKSTIFLNRFNFYGTKYIKYVSFKGIGKTVPTSNIYKKEFNFL